MQNASLMLLNKARKIRRTTLAPWHSIAFPDNRSLKHNWLLVVILFVDPTNIVLFFFLFVESSVSTFVHFFNICFKFLVGSLMACSVYVVVFLKLWSYSQANKWYRNDYNKAMTKRKIQRTSE